MPAGAPPEHTPRLALLGCPLDSDERHQAVEAKRAALGRPPVDPLDRVLQHLRGEVDPSRWYEAARLEVPPWLWPIPPPEEAEALAVENFVHFIDADGCRDFAQSAGRMAAQAALPEVPCLVGVDHSLAGGVMARLAQEYGPRELGVVVLDSHTDAIPTPALCGAIAYDREHNPHSPYQADDPFLRHRPHSYNASSFLRHLLDEGLLEPRNLLLVGVCDHPPRHAFRLKDPRLQDYLDAYRRLKEQGVRLVTRKDLSKGTGKLQALLRSLRVSRLYVSVDLDVGSQRAVSAVRFDERVGLGRGQLYRVAQVIAGRLGRGTALAGLDLCEFDCRRAEQDPAVYRVAADLIQILAWGRKAGELQGTLR